MNPLQYEIASAFGQGEQPEGRDLVIWDGVGELDKKRAVGFYSGKHWLDLLEFLRGARNRSMVGAHAYLEEWGVLSPPAIAYYARAYLDFLLETAASAEPNEEFVFYFLGELFHLVDRVRPFNAIQTDLLRRVVAWISERAAEPGVFEYFADDIQHDAEEILAEIAAHGG